MSLQLSDGGISSANTDVQAPELNTPGTTVTINGFGFQQGCKVVFGAGPHGPQVTPTSVSADGRYITVPVAPMAISGYIYVVQPDGVAVQSPQTTKVNDFYQYSGFGFANYFQSGVYTDLTDLTNLFGYDATHDSIGPVTFTDPFAALFLGHIDQALSDGQCFGFILAASRFLYNDAQTLNYAPYNSEFAHGLLAPNDPSNPSGYGAGSLLSYIHEQHIAQDSAQSLKQQADNAEYHSNLSSQGLETEISNDVSGNRATIVCIHDFNEGHAVLAYGVEPGSGPGDFYIDCYDPNRPYDPNADPAIQLQTLEDSRIHVMANDTWQFSGDFGPPITPAEEIWSGPFNQMTFIPYGTIPVQPTLPYSLGGLAIVLGGAAATQVSDPSGHTLFNPDGSLNSNPATELTSTSTVNDDLSTGSTKIAIGETNLTQTLTSTGTPSARFTWTTASASA